MKSKKDRVAALVGELSALTTTLRSLNGMQQGLPASLLLELTMAQLRTLIVLLSTGGAPSRGLAERLRVSASAVTPLVDKLVEHGLARREDDPTDRRISWIRPTAEAHTLYEELTSVNQSSLEEIASELTAEEISEVQRGFAIFSAAAKRRLEAARCALSNDKEGAE